MQLQPSRMGKGPSMKTNIATRERVVRIVAGIVLAIAGVLFILKAGALGSQALAAAGVILGLDLVITGATGFCPLYVMLGRATAKRGSEDVSGRS